MILARGAHTAQPQLEKTVVLPPAQAASMPTPEADKKGREFVLDLDSFSRNFEADEQTRLGAYEAERRNKGVYVMRWGYAEARKREAFERGR